MAKNPNNNSVARVVAFETASSTSFANIIVPMKLTNTYYLSWKTQLLPLLRANDLISHIDGSSFLPLPIIDGEPNLMFIGWNFKD